MRVVASIGDELCGKAGSADAGGYRGVLLIKNAGNVEHRNAAVGQVGKDAKRNRFGSLMVSAPGFQRAGQRLCIAGSALGSNGGARFRGKRSAKAARAASSAGPSPALSKTSPASGRLG